MSNQIVKYQTATKLICFTDKLQKVDRDRYAQIHAKGEKIVDGHKQNSLIGVQIFDYTNGTGDKNVITQFNLMPEQVQFFLSRVTLGVPVFQWSSSKIFGDPGPDGRCQAQSFNITRNPQRKDGAASTSPWCISISNGRGVKMQNKMGGFYMKKESYVQEKAGFVNLTDMDLFVLLTRVDSFIRCWESAATISTLLQDKRLNDEAFRAGQAYPRS